MDLISRQDVFDMIDAVFREECEKRNTTYEEADEMTQWYLCGMMKVMEKVFDIPSASRWIPVKTRPMTQEEREYYELHWDADLDDEAVLFDCPMPYDKQTIWVTTKNGYLFQDTCENDDGYIGLEGNEDWYDISAWMPVLVPDPYKEEE